MTPAEHYEKAEECVAEVMRGIANRQAGGTGDWDFATPLALAQVHATLASCDPARGTATDRHATPCPRDVT